MKRRIYIFLAVAAIAFVILAWWFWPQLHFKVALTQLSSVGGVPTHRGAADASFSVDTYTDDVSSATIGDLYYAACSRLEHLRGSYPRRTYHWKDLQGWDRVTSVVQFPAGSISVTVANNNDNDSVFVRVEPGTFSPDHFPKVKELPNDRLPPRTLRFQ